MKKQNQVFHTRHDFKPELAWAAFQLLTELRDEEITDDGLLKIATTLASPLAKRTELSKLISSFVDLGFIDRVSERIILSEAGRALAENLGRYEHGFYTALHCVYFWKWLLSGEKQTASPSWSYREVCRQILDSRTVGITSDEIVLRVVSSATENFTVDKVSFSRSSVSGVTTWLEAQIPPLIKREGQHLYQQYTFVPSVDTLRLNLTALCAFNNGESELNAINLRLLSECFLSNIDDIRNAIITFTENSPEFVLTSNIPSRIVFRQSDEPFVNWIIRQAI